MLTLLGNDPAEIMAYERFISNHPKGHFMQSSLWGQVKEDWEFKVLVLRDESGAIKGTMAILIRPLGFLGFKIAYAPRGPVCDIEDEAALYELLSGAVNFIRQKGCCRLTIDPDVECDCQALQSAAKRAGFEAPRKNMNFESIQARFVVRLELKDKSYEELLSLMEPKTRYNIRKAQRSGVRVEWEQGAEAMESFYRLMQMTGKRDKFFIRSIDYFRRVMDCMGEHARLYLAYVEDTPVAGIIALHYGDKLWYLYGASDNEFRNKMPTYALQWEMILWAKELGCRLYDLRGVPGDDDPENPLFGLYRFKKGFGGKKTEFVGEFLYQNGMCRNRVLAMLMVLRKRMLKRKANKA